MTREEAIALIENHKIFHKMNEPRAIYILEALDIAIKALEQQPCEDAVSRQTVKNQMTKYGFHSKDMTVTEFVEDLPPVKLQEPKTGHWISLDDFRGKYNENGFMCSECNEHSDYEENFCPNCGTKMSEIPTGSKPQESEVNNG